MQVLYLTIFMAFFWWESNYSTVSQPIISYYGPMEDAQIVGNSKKCNAQGFSRKDIKNNSQSKFLTVTIQKQTITGLGNPVRTTSVVERLAPQEQRELGCQGCGQTTTGRYCESYKVLAAVYVDSNTP